MKHSIRFTVTAVALALASTGAFAMGDRGKADKQRTAATQSSTDTTTRGTGTTTSAERSATGAEKSGLPTGQGTTTAEAAKQRSAEDKVLQGQAADDNLGRTRKDEMPASGDKGKR